MIVSRAVDCQELSRSISVERGRRLSSFGQQILPGPGRWRRRQHHAGFQNIKTFTTFFPCVWKNWSQVISIKNYAHDLRVIIQLMQYHNKVSSFLNDGKIEPFQFSQCLRIWRDETFWSQAYLTWQNVCIPGLPDEHSKLVSLQWRWCHLPCRAQGEPEIRPCLKGKLQTVKGKVGNILKIKTLWLNFSTSPAGFHRPVLPRTGLHHLDGKPLCYEVNHFIIINW